ncbi:helix-turn-helix transcriptional regulator [Peptoniphilus stercorisuis]|uniref:Transcriptional regulator YheO n=1 Tax=Peptoniphilus stercorisuis TaxID=1436965 RepID=A0ABS4KDD3_9FIRM|nr:PAS domain-containing protein [Peptoniphilus stercorisuis]MBP2025775.1 putative transcriptional regulator YheO [Peptoniphilus stercorisuis]
MGELDNKELLKNMAVFLHEALGMEYEIVYHNLENDGYMVEYLANGQISGRREEDYTKETLLELLGDCSDKNFVINTRGRVENNKVMKHSSFLYRDKHGNLEGVLCINFDISKLVNIAKEILKLTNMSNALIGNEKLETFDFKNNLVSDLVEHIIVGVFNDALMDKNSSLEDLSQDEKMEIVRKLKEKEVFLYKEAVPKISEKLGVSKATIYRYLQTIQEDSI